MCSGQAYIQRSRCTPSGEIAGSAETREPFDNVASSSYIDAMKTVGVRELKNRLSEYIRHVRSGEAVLITDRGEIVAEMTPPGRESADAAIPAGLVALARRKLASPGLPADAKLYPPLPRRRRRRQTAAQLLDQERGRR